MRKKLVPRFCPQCGSKERPAKAGARSGLRASVIAKAPAAIDELSAAETSNDTTANNFAALFSSFKEPGSSR